MSDLGGRNADGLTGRQFTWTLPLAQSGDYSFTIQNNLQQAVQNVLCLVIFYDIDNQPIDVDIVKYKDVIPPKLAKRVTSRVHESVQKLTTREEEATPHTKLEFRILDFQIVEESEEGL